MSDREDREDEWNPCIRTDEKTHVVLGVWVVHLSKADLLRKFASVDVNGDWREAALEASGIYAANVLVLLHREKESGKYVVPARLRLQVDDIVGPESKDRRIAFELTLPNECGSDLEAYDTVTKVLERAHPGVEVHHRLVVGDDLTAALRSLPGMHVTEYKQGEN